MSESSMSFYFWLSIAVALSVWIPVAIYFFWELAKEIRREDQIDAEHGIDRSKPPWNK